MTKKVFAYLTSEDADILNIQFATWKIAVEHWKKLKARTLENRIEDNRILEQLFAILIIAGASLSQLLVGKIPLRKVIACHPPRECLKKYQNPLSKRHSQILMKFMMH